MAIVQPIPVADYGQIIRNSLGVYRDVRQMEDQDEINQLAQNSYTDPVAWEQLKRKAPEKAAQIQQVSNVDLDRFFKYRAGTSLELIGKPPEQQAEILARKAKELKDQGRDPSNTLEMRQRILSGDETVQPELQGYVEQGYQMGYLQRPPQQKSETTALQKNLAAAGIKPGTKEYRDAILAGTKGGVSVTVGGANPKKFAEKLAESQIKQYDTVQETAIMAEDQLQSLNELEAMDVKQGALEPMKVQLGAVGESLGIDMSGLVNVPAGQAYNAQAKKMVLTEMQKQKGPQTESDMKLIRQTVAGLGQTPDANKFLIKSAKSQAMRKVEQRDFMENWLNEKGNLDGASKAWNEYKRSVPMISKNLKQGGLPMFYYEFEEYAREQDPTATREQIIEQWNKKDKEVGEMLKSKKVPFSKAVESSKPVPMMMNEKIPQTTYTESERRMRGLSGTGY